MVPTISVVSLVLLRAFFAAWRLSTTQDRHHRLRGPQRHCIERVARSPAHNRTAHQVISSFCVAPHTTHRATTRPSWPQPAATVHAPPQDGALCPRRSLLIPMARFCIVARFAYICNSGIMLACCDCRSALPPSRPLIGWCPLNGGAPHRLLTRALSRGPRVATTQW